MLNGSLFSLAQITLSLNKDCAFIRMSMDKFKSVGTNVGSGKKTTRKRKKKCKTTSGHKIPSLFTSATSSSLVSGDETDSDQNFKADSGSRHKSASKKKTVHVQTEYDPESTNKFIIRKQKYKVVLEKRSIFPSATSSSHPSEELSEGEWVCETKHDVVVSKSPENTNKIVLARAKGKSNTRESNTKRSTTKRKHKSTRGRKRRFPSVPSSSLASADASGSGWTCKADRCKTNRVLRTTHNSKKQILQDVDTKAVPEVTRKRNYRLSPTRHKYKSVLKKRRVPGPKCATVNPSGSDSNENISNLQVSPFIDLTYWKMTKICCGIIFKGLNGEVMIDAKLYKPCKPGCKEKTLVKETTQCNQSRSNANAGETDFNSASNMSTTDSMGQEMDA